MLKRTITAIIGLPLVIFIVHHGGWPLLLMCLIVSLVGLRELYRAFSKEDRYIHIVGYVIAVGYFFAAFVFGVGNWLLISVALLVIIVQTCLVVAFPKLTLADVAVTVYGFLYVPFLISFLMLVREHPYGQFFVWLIFTSAFGCDTFAYLTGVTIGRHKLVNTPSPKKSVEGLIGGVLGAALVGFFYGFFVVRFAEPGVEHFIVISTVISLFGAVFSIVGDMSASALKRHAQIKDFGALLPGHGGVVDRADSIIFVAPFVYSAMIILFNIIMQPGVY